MITRNTGSDIIPFAPSYPGARLRAIKALRNAKERREREAPPPDEAFNAERLRRDLASLPPDVRVNGDEREHLRKMGWTPERLTRAQVALHENLGRRVHPQSPATVTAGAGGRATRSRPSLPSSRTDADVRGMAANMRAAWARGVDPAEVWPSLRGLVASVSPDRPAMVDQGHQGPGEGSNGWNPSTPWNRSALRATGRRPR
jgi:hypothetical protein